MSSNLTTWFVFYLQPAYYYWYYSPQIHAGQSSINFHNSGRRRLPIILENDLADAGGSSLRPIEFPTAYSLGVAVKPRYFTFMDRENTLNFTFVRQCNS